MPAREAQFTKINKFKTAIEWNFFRFKQCAKCISPYTRPTFLDYNFGEMKVRSKVECEEWRPGFRDLNFAIVPKLLKEDWEMLLP